MTKLRLALSLFAALSYSLISLPSHASLVSVHYTATIVDKSSQLTSFQIGDKIEWGIAYNASGTYANLYYDGSNLIAEQGQGDDRLFRQACLNSIGPNCTHEMAGSGLQVLSDTSFNFGSLLSDMKGDQLEYSRYSKNWSYVMGYVTDPRQPVTQLLQNDWYEMELRGSNGFIRVSTEVAGRPVSKSLMFNSIVAEVTLVPVPAATWLFISGLISLIGIPKHKK